jgi:hypothetical protein
MTVFSVKHMLDPVRTSREEGRLAGRKEMRDLLRSAFASFAAAHPDPVISDELWTFVNHIERANIT